MRGKKTARCVEQTESEQLAQERRWSRQLESVEGDLKGSTARSVSPFPDYEMQIHLVRIRTFALDGSHFQVSVPLPTRQTTSIGCIPHPLMVSPMVNVPDIQITEPVSFLYTAPQLSGSPGLEYVPLSTFHSVAYLTWGGVTPGFGRG